ncbi:Protein SERAC1 [Fusarium oxysporum f. sp. albedinis]|nr:Protein SERAC1 [Fusarium oxysporum f. sp. albedinis]
MTLEVKLSLLFGHQDICPLGNAAAQYPGNFIITQQAQHHMVINMGPCMTQSINFALAGDSLCSPNFIKCPIRQLVRTRPC